MFYFSFSFLCWAWSSRALYSRHRSPTEPPSQLSQLFIHEVGAQETAACGLPIILYCNVASHSLDESSLRDLFGLWQRPSFLEPHGRVYRSKTKDVSSPALGRKSSLMPTETRRQGRAQLCPIVHPSELKGCWKVGLHHLRYFSVAVGLPGLRLLLAQVHNGRDSTGAGVRCSKKNSKMTAHSLNPKQEAERTSWMWVCILLSKI